MCSQTYKWKRYWCPREGRIVLSEDGYLVDPEGISGRVMNRELVPFGSVADVPCLVLLGEPGIGKTYTMRAERQALDGRVAAQGGETLWLDLWSIDSGFR